MNQPTSRLFGGILLISGTTIGAGMLALPVVTGLAGFYPTLLLLFFYWAYMTYTAFLMLEVNLWMEPGTNLITMAKNTLGRWGEAVSWGVYLLLLYLLTAAYMAGSGPITLRAIHGLTGYTLPAWTGAFPLILIFGFFVYKGTKYVDYINRLLMIGMAVAFVGIMGYLSSYTEDTLLRHVDLSCITAGISVVATSFGYHIIIPTLSTYMNRDIKRMKQALIIGSLVPLAIYTIWVMVSLSVLPLEGEYGIIKGYTTGDDAITLMTRYLGSNIVYLIGQFFAFFAIVTSFLGVSLSLMDFLADGLHIKKNSFGRLSIFLLTFVPPLLFIFTYPRAFFSALEYAGAFGVIILLGLLPALMVWAGRYQKGFHSTFKTPGGKIALVVVIVVSFFVIGVEVANKLGYTKCIN